MNTNENTEDITVQWCIISESLNNFIHAKGEHGYAATLGGYRTFYHHKLFAHNKGRNPSIGGEDYTRTGLLDFQNNVIYNWISRVCDGKPQTMYFVANYYKQGLATQVNTNFIILKIQASERYSYTSIEKNREYNPFENANYMTRDATLAYLDPHCSLWFVRD